MSTIAQITANPLNAKSSPGPSTPEGKANSSRNPTTHGLSGSFTLLRTRIAPNSSASSIAMPNPSAPPMTTNPTWSN